MRILPRLAEDSGGPGLAEPDRVVGEAAGVIGIRRLIVLTDGKMLL